MKPHNYTPKATCPACGRAVNRNNAGVIDAHYDHRTGKPCPGKVEPQPAVALVEKLPAPWEEK